MASSCTFDPTNPTAFPFTYYSSNGSVINDGTPVTVPGYTQPVCTFPNAACRLSHNPSFNGKTFSCCKATDALSDQANVWFIPMIAFFGPYFLVLFLYPCVKFIWRVRIRGEDRAVVRADMKKRQFVAGMSTKKTMSKALGLLLAVVYVAAIIALVVEATIMPKSIQRNLSPADRAAQLAMSSFLTPVEEVFAFLEDTMVVKVGYALEFGRLEELNLLLHVSGIGGALSGALAFVVMLVIALNKASAAALLNPSASSNAALIAKGCPFIPTTPDLLSHARLYWLLAAGAWAPKFMVAGVSGFLAGTGNWLAYLFPMIVTSSVPVALWFGLLPLAQTGGALSPLSVLGVAGGVGDWLTMVGLLAYLALSASLRREFGIKWRVDGHGVWRMVREVAREGLELMVVDLAVQLSLTVTIYIAASRDVETAYKIGAAQAAYWTFGPSYLMGFMLFLKVTGSQLVASGKHAQYRRFFGFVFGLTLSMSIAAVVAALLKRVPVAFEYGESACIFAANPACASAYAAIFRGSDALASVFEAFGPTVGLNMLFCVLRTGLATAQDFNFMAKASSAALLVVYVPAIMVAHYVVESTVSFYLAMYVPHFVMVVVFGWRMKRHLTAMALGRDGPWTRHMRPSDQLRESLIQ